jgi:hypothetical protein
MLSETRLDQILNALGSGKCDSMGVAELRAIHNELSGPPNLGATRQNQARQAAQTIAHKIERLESKNTEAATEVRHKETVGIANESLSVSRESLRQSRHANRIAWLAFGVAVVGLVVGPVVALWPRRSGDHAPAASTFAPPQTQSKPPVQPIKADAVASPAPGTIPTQTAHTNPPSPQPKPTANAASQTNSTK